MEKLRAGARPREVTRAPGDTARPGSIGTRRRRAARAAIALVLPWALGASDPRPASADGSVPILHEPIPPDPREDLAMHVTLPGDLPPAIRTAHGQVTAPDPEATPSSSDAAYSNADTDRFRADRDTRRPTVGSYDDPFTPSTAPFKRLSAFDAVRDDYTLGVRDDRQFPVTDSTPAGPEDDSFFADMLVDVAIGRRVRIPSVGPGARVVHGRLGVGSEDLPFRVLHDGADNWFLQATGGSASLGSGSGRRARFVAELAIPRRALGGEFGDVSWPELPMVSPLPEAVARDAAIVRATIGVSRRMRPRDAVTRLVQYFRGFAESDDPPRGRGSLYLDLALSKKGVCRHRAFAFLITALSLGIPSRMIVNEAHAWVEVNDGTLWRRIDLGGAGRLERAPNESRQAYEPLPDAFQWPQGSKRGQDMVPEAVASGSNDGAGGSGSNGAGGAGPGGPGASGSDTSRRGVSGGANATRSGHASAGQEPASSDEDESASSADRNGLGGPIRVRVELTETTAHRGDPLTVRGAATSGGEACDHTTVEVWMRGAPGDPGRMVRLGSLATDDRGSFAGSVTLPPDAPLGDYDVFARPAQGAHCGGPVPY